MPQDDAWPSVDRPPSPARAGLTDPLGNPVSAMPAAAKAGLDAFVEGFLAYEERAAQVVAAADAAPNACLVNAYAGMLHLLAETPDAPDNAAPYLARAEAAASLALEREQRAVRFLSLWRDGDIDAALDESLAIVTAWPRDLVMLKLHQYHAFNRGDFAAMLRIAELGLAAAPDVPQMWGMAAFAYEQCHLLDEAEAAARRAITLQRKEPWAHHALAHVMLTQGRIDEGAAFLEGVSETWTGLNSFMVTHAWWHLALFYLSQGRDAEALRLYDEQCWAVSKAYSQDQVGAVSLLARLELAGIDSGGRWDDLGGYLAARGEDLVQPFLTLQYLYGLARAGRPEAHRLLAAVQARAADPAAEPVWRDVAAPAAEGLVAYAEGNVEAAVRALGTALPRMIEIGGSHAQRDLFELIHLDAVIRCGRLDQAQQALELRRGFDPQGVVVNRKLAEVYAGLGLPRQAQQASDRARTTAALHARTPS